MLHAIEPRPELLLLLLLLLLPPALLHSRLSPPLPPLFARLQVLVQAGAYVKDDACRALILLVVNAAQLHAYAARACYRALTANLEAAQPSLLMVATWCLGAGASRRVGAEGPVGLARPDDKLHLHRSPCSALLWTLSIWLQASTVSCWWAARAASCWRGRRRWPLARQTWWACWRRCCRCVVH